MTLSQAWMQQAESDFKMAQRVDNDDDPKSRCQAISKYQQSVEKSIKSILDKLNEADVTSVHSDSRHPVARYTAVFVNLPRTEQTGDLLTQLARIFTKSTIEQIRLLDSLVPEYPSKGGLARRNHEYPFQTSVENWRAPSEADIFTTGEMKRIRRCAGSLILGLRRILDGLDLLPKSE